MNRRNFITGLGAFTAAGVVVSRVDAAVKPAKIISAKQPQVTTFTKVDPKYIIRVAHDILDRELEYKATFGGVPESYYEERQLEARNGTVPMISGGRYYYTHSQVGVDFEFPGVELGLSNDEFVRRYITPTMLSIANKLKEESGYIKFYTLAKPNGLDWSEVYIGPRVSLRLVRGYDIRSDQFINRIDVLYDVDRGLLG